MSEKLKKFEQALIQFSDKHQLLRRGIYVGFAINGFIFYRQVIIAPFSRWQNLQLQSVYKSIWVKMQSKDINISLPRVNQDNLSHTQSIDLHWKNLTVNVTEKKSSKQATQISDSLLEKPNVRIILNNVTGYAKAGQMTAIMGPSGAGKTTLVALLSKRYKPGPNTNISGELLANNTAYKHFNDFGAFVMQDDLLMATMTVKGINI